MSELKTGQRIEFDNGVTWTVEKVYPAEVKICAVTPTNERRFRMRRSEFVTVLEAAMQVGTPIPERAVDGGGVMKVRDARPGTTKQPVDPLATTATGQSTFEVSHDPLNSAPAAASPDGGASSPVPAAEPVVLVRGKPDWFYWSGDDPAGALAAVWCCAPDAQPGCHRYASKSDRTGTQFHRTAEEAAAHIGAILPAQQPLTAEAITGRAPGRDSATAGESGPDGLVTDLQIMVPPNDVVDLAGEHDITRLRMMLEGAVMQRRAVSRELNDARNELNEIRRVLAPVIRVGDAQGDAVAMARRAVDVIESQAAEIQTLRDMLGTNGHPSAALNHLGRVLGDAGFGVPDCDRKDCRSVHLNDRIHRALAKNEALAEQIHRLEIAAQRLRNQVLFLGPVGCGDEFDTLDEMARRWQQAEDAQARAAGMLTRISLCLDACGKVNAPEMSTPERVQALINYTASVEKEGAHYGALCSDAHAALNRVGEQAEGSPADRIRALAARTYPANGRIILLYAIAGSLDGTGHGALGRAELLRLLCADANVADLGDRRDRAVVSLALAEAELVAAGLEAGGRGEGDSWEDLGDMVERVVETLLARVEDEGVSDG